MNKPPTHKLEPFTANANTTLFVPLPNTFQFEPSHRAMRLALNPPATVNTPPTYKSEPLTHNASTSLFAPLPNTFHCCPTTKCFKTKSQNEREKFKQTNKQANEREVRIQETYKLKHNNKQKQEPSHFLSSNKSLQTTLLFVKESK